MRVALLTEGGYPYAHGRSAAWCDRLLRGLAGHDFEVCALSRGRQQAAGPRLALPPNVRRVRTAPLWGPPPPAAAVGGRARAGRLGRRFAECFAELTGALCGGPQAQDQAQADRFASGLYGLAELAAAHGGLVGWLRSEQAVRVLEAACRVPGAPRAVHAVRVPELLAVADRLERALRPLSLDWYAPGNPGVPGGGGLSGVALCHAVGGGLAAVPGLLARRFFGTPLLITEDGVGVREHYLTSAASAAHAVAPVAAGAPVRALLAAFQILLAREAYARAALITPGHTQARRWQERCGAERARLRTVYPGTDPGPYRTVADPTAAGGPVEPARLVWVGRVEPVQDLVGLLYALRLVRAAEPRTGLLVGYTGYDAGYLGQCRGLAARLFPGQPDAVTFAEAGGPGTPSQAEAYAAGAVAVLCSAVEGFPVPLVEAMFSARATVSTDVGAVTEVIGGTGLVVPPSDPRALADACLALLRDPERRARLGAAARARALELFTVERTVAAFDGIYLELMCAQPGAAEWRGGGLAAAGVPFARPAEAHLSLRPPGAGPSWARRPAPAASAPGASGLEETR